MAAANISPQMQNQLAQFEQIRQQLQMVMSQRLQIESQLREVETALEEIGSISDDTPIYKNVGSLMVKAKDKKDVETDLNEQKETLEVRVKTLERQENQLKERYQSLQKDLTEAAQRMEGRSAVSESDSEGED
jgi:prefoldin beta subunit